MKRVSGLDVHKDTVFCRIYDGKKQEPVKEYSTLTPSTRAMGEDLHIRGVIQCNGKHKYIPDTYMEELCQKHYGKEMSLLLTIPGISNISAMIILAETGADMKAFENSGKFSGWTGDYVQEMIKVPENTRVLLQPRTIVFFVQFWFRLRGLTTPFINWPTQLVLKRTLRTQT